MRLNEFITESAMDTRVNLRVNQMVDMALKHYQMDSSVKEDVISAIIEDYDEWDINELTMQDVAEIMDASGFEPGFDDDDEELMASRGQRPVAQQRIRKHKLR